ncbi:helix-turn-helix transcriptional regulator [Kitasatospora sp. NPDC096147]|uniref:helix-turn-helix transcriptional regulator n=1 Tax=Kitasatospora sp. NPDC096147 TaxID=3364093 RepID=UPI00382FA5E1
MGGSTFGRYLALRRAELGWTQSRLAAEVRRSEDWMSSVERDVQQVKDLVLLRRLAEVLGCGFEELAELPQPAAGRVRVRARGPRGGRAASVAPASTAPAGGGTVEGEGRRRPFETVAAAALFVPLPPRRAADAVHADPEHPGGVAGWPLAGLEDLLLYGAVRWPAGEREPGREMVAEDLLRSRQEFGAARYDALAAALPGRIAVAGAVGPAEERARALARLYNLAARLCIKLGDNGLVAVTADRALTAARAGGDPLVTAEARRMVSSAWRRQGSLVRATDIVVRAAEELLGETTVPEPDRLATRADLYATAAYTAAKNGDRAYAHALIREAADSAAAAGRASGLVDGVRGVVLHELSVHYELGDAGRAVEVAAGVDPAALPSAERRARYFIDLARAFDQWDKPERCHQALLAAEEAAPQEIRRGVVRDLTAGLLRHDRRVPGVRDLAVRAGVPGV